MAVFSSLPPSDEFASLDSVSPETLPRALEALRKAKNTVAERAAIDAVMRARVHGNVPDELLMASASVLARRGETREALSLLEPCHGPAALLMKADLHAECNETARALLLIERALCRDISLPGGLERHGKWLRALRGAPKAEERAFDTTLLAPNLPDADYTLLAEAGRGGSGTVFEALDIALGRKVALKIYHRPEDDREKLLCEARVAANLSGPGVVHVFDVDPERGHVVMEWASEGALRTWIAEHAIEKLLPIERWFVPLMHALQRVHAACVVHGDLKPGNIMFRSQTEPLLSDFALARPIGEHVEGGSPGYLSPERLDGAALDPRDDVFALGRVLQEVLGVVGDAPDALRWVQISSACRAAAARDRPSLAQILSWP
jgi:serine/threonine-protein kinase